MSCWVLLKEGTHDGMEQLSRENRDMETGASTTGPGHPAHTAGRTRFVWRWI